MEYVVQRERLGAGRHYGRIRIRSVHQMLEFNIEASVAQGECLVPKNLKKRKTVELAQDYLALQMHRMDYRTWFDKTVASLQELTMAECMDPMLVFYEAFVFYMNENNSQAMELLWSFKQGKLPLKTPAENGIYRYLAKLVNLLEPEQQNILPKIKAYAQQQPESFFLLKILLEEDDSCKNAPVQQLHLMEQAFERGCRSPFLYLSAYQLLQRQEKLFRKLSLFIIQVLNFAGRQGMQNDPLLRRAAYLSDNLKEFHPAVYRLLAGGYDLSPSDQVLEAICKMVMKETPTKKEYFRWYRLAVEHEVRITRLYEYYIETMEEDSRQMLPQVIRMYFAYNNTLSAGKKALIYANVIRNKDQDKTTYGSYQKAMQDFAGEQLRAGRMNDDYAVIYREFIREVDQELLARRLLQVLFVQKVIVSDRHIRKVIVCHNALSKEQIYPVTDRRAYVNLYGGDARILFEDEKRRRYGVTVKYTVEKLMDEKELARQCGVFGLNDPGLLLYSCKGLPSQMDVNAKSISSYQIAAENEAFTDDYRDVIRKKLLTYYMVHPGGKALREFFMTVDVQEYARVSRGETVAVLSAQGMYEQAFSVVARWGVEGVDTTVLMKLAGRIILYTEFKKDEELLHLAGYVMNQGKYDEVILSYLRDYYMGSVEQMCFLWEKVKGFQLESRCLDERILVYSMYVRGFPKDGERILESYIMQQGKELVIHAFLTYISCAAFMTDQGVSREFFTYLEKTYAHGWEMDVICRLALLKSYSCRGSLSGNQEQYAAEILKECSQKGLRFAFFQKLPLHLVQAYQVEDKVFVEERFKPGSKVVIHYCLRRGDSEVAGFKSEPMREMYQGIFTKEFLLFYGETLTYYMSVEKDGEESDSPRKEITLQGVETRGRTRYKLLNHMLAAKALGNQEAVQTALKLYLQQEAFVDAAFTIMG